jgi:nucleotide-binding universal stress UspA family protein
MTTGTIGAIHRTVVGVDGSPAALAALDWAATQAESTGATVVAVATWSWPRGFGQAVLIPGDYDPAADAEALVRGAIDDARAHHPRVEFVSRVIEGRATDVLVEASRGADLLAVGSRGHGEVAGLLLGSVSEHCASHAHSPVLVIRDAT